jgi:hypothetical protein
MGSQVRARKFVVAILVAAGVVVIAGGIATARIKTESKTTTVGVEQNGKANAKCPRGSEAISGGFASPGFDPTLGGGPRLFHFTSKRGGDRKWKTRSHNFGGESGKLKSIAYCDTSEPNLKVETKTKAVDAQSNGSATAKCPSGSEAISGGWAPKGPIADDEELFAWESRRKGDRKWKVSAFNNANTSAPLAAYAYCDEHGPNLKAKSDKVNVAEAQKRSAKANCKHGEKAYSGGYKGKVDGQADGPFAIGSKRTGGGDWKGQAFFNGSGGPAPFKVYAYCK